MVRPRSFDRPSSVRCSDPGLTPQALDERGIDKVICAGDIVERGADGDAVVELLQEHMIASVAGNHDQNALRDAQMPVFDGPGQAAAHHGRELATETLALLALLPPSLEYWWEGLRLLVAHGIPGNNGVGVTSEQVPKAFKRVMRRLEADVLVLGHTHRPMKLRLGRLFVINPGSVCQLRARDSHTCAILSLPSCDLEQIDLGDRGAPTLP